MYDGIKTWTLLALWLRLCISVEPYSRVISSGYLVHTPHIAHFDVSSHFLQMYMVDTLYLTCPSQCCIGCITGTLQGAFSAQTDAESDHFDITDRGRRNCEFLRSRLPCDCHDCVMETNCECCDGCSLPKIFNYFCCPLLKAHAVSDCCAYAAVSILHNLCVRTPPTGEARLLLREMD